MKKALKDLIFAGAVLSNCLAAPGDLAPPEEGAQAPVAAVGGVRVNPLCADEVCLSREAAKDLAAASGEVALKEVADALEEVNPFAADAIRRGAEAGVHRATTDFSVDTSYSLVDRIFSLSGWLFQGRENLLG